jgi:hypothetical protein
VVQNDKCGLVVPAGKVETLAEALQRLASSRDLRGALGTRARERVLKNYTVEKEAAALQSIYEEIVQQNQVIVLPGYFMRYIPLLGLELSWLYVGFRQAAYEAGAARQPGKKFGAPAKKVARYAGMSLRTFRRWSAKPDTWQRLQGMVTPVDDKPQWQHGSDGHPHRTPRYYRVSMTLPLTPSYELSLRAWLYKRLSEGKSALAVIQAALETPVNELIPWQETTLPLGDNSIELHSVQGVLHAVCGPISESERTQFQELTDKLAQHRLPGSGSTRDDDQRIAAQ